MEMVIVGSMGYDDIQTPEENGSEILGGAASHSGLAASFHMRPLPGKPPRIGIVSAVGDDFSTYHQMVLEDAGMNLSGVVVAEGKTFRWSGKYDDSMDRVTTISTDLNVLENFTPVIPDAWSEPDVLFCANAHPRIQLAALNQCPGARITVLDSFRLWIEDEFELLSEAMRNVDVVIINEEEVCSIADEQILTKAISSVMSGSSLHGGKSAGPGPRSLIVKRGSSGVLAHLPCGTIALPSYPTENMVDPTGCGDTFAGALFACLIGHESPLNDSEVMRNALVHATVTASYCVEQLGTKGVRGLGRGAYHARADRYRRIVGI